MHLRLSLLVISLIALRLACAQNPLLDVVPQNNTFNSTFRLSDAQIRAANLTRLAADALETVTQYARSDWAGQSVQSSFYTALPANTSNAGPGDILKIEHFTDSSLYTIPPGTALSRFIYVSETLNGSTVPASAYVLWPYLPAQFKGIKGVPTIVWAHGATGGFAECAPSHLRDLGPGFLAPFDLVLAGYAVVAPDYAGLGVSHYPDGREIIHEFLANPAAGKDVLFAQRAALAAFPQLSSEFVIMGHSQGGGAAWGTTQLLASQSFIEKKRASGMWKGYRGTVAVAPITNVRKVLHAQEPAVNSGFLPIIAQQFPAFFGSSYKPTDILTHAGIIQGKLMREISSCGAAIALPLGKTITQPHWQNSHFLKEFSRVTQNGGKKFIGPMLVIQGETDTAVAVDVTKSAVVATCKAQPQSQLEYVQVPGMEHEPVLFGARTVWMNWIRERFEGKSAKQGCKTSTLKPLRKLSEYHAELNYFTQLALHSYEIN